MISNCGNDENKKYSGGKAGDQTGTEWRIINWYNRPWKCVLRHPDAAVRAMICQMAKDAANNNNIGYDQSQRLTFWQQLEKCDYEPSKIKVACEADCSAGVGAICKATGYKLGIQKLKDISVSVYTGSLRTALKNAGFEVLTDSKYLISDAYLLEGDILLNDGHHVATNITNGSKSGMETVLITNNGVKKGSNVHDSVMVGIQAWVNNYCKAGVTIDAEFGPQTKKGLCKALQKTLNENFGKKLTVDGEFGPATKAACPSASKHKNLTYIAQAMLYAKGYNMSHSISNNELDGKYGSGMKATVKQFQKDKKLTQDGDCGANTFYALFN